MTILTKVYVVLAMIAGILASIFCIAFFGLFTAWAVELAMSWWKENKKDWSFSGLVGNKAAQA